MRKLPLGLAMIVTALMAVWAGAPWRGTTTATALESNSTAPELQQLDLPTTIDGSVNPQLIPDTVAYSLFFNFFSNRAESDRGKLQSYCNQTALANVPLNALLRAAANYRERVAGIDAQAERLRNGVPSDATIQPQLQAQFSALQTQREVIINDAIARLPDFVGAEGASAVRRHIDQRIKTHTKISTGPRMPGDQQ